MDQNSLCSNVDNNSDDNIFDENINKTFYSRAKDLLSYNCISLRKLSLITNVSTLTLNPSTAERKQSHRQHQKLYQNFFQLQNTEVDKEKNFKFCSSKQKNNQTIYPNFLFHEQDPPEKCNDIVQVQPTREAPYYYGDIVRTRNLDASKVFQQSLKSQSKNQHKTQELISILNLNKASSASSATGSASAGALSVETITLEKENLSTRKRHLKVPDHIMDGIRVQLKNAGSRLKSATSTTTNTPQRLRHQQVSRSNESHVSLRGWLYRLEGGALKQWKRRWCVLADYCLFYYKDMAEQKLLGSALLPSFKINPCLSGDGISRKYSFKIEHSNMKTYYFAADTKEIQQQWMSALSMASIMQLNIFQTQKRLMISLQNCNDKAADNSQIMNETNQFDNSLMKHNFSLTSANENFKLQHNSDGTTLNSACCTKLRYAPDGYPLSNMIDEQTKDMFPIEFSLNNDDNSNQNQNNYNYRHYRQNEITTKNTDEMNGLPKLVPTNTNPDRSHYRRQESQFVQQYNLMPIGTATSYNSPTAAAATAPASSSSSFQSTYNCIQPYQYTGIDESSFHAFQQAPHSFSQAGGITLYNNHPTMIPPPKPRRVAPQQYLYSEEQFFDSQAAMIFDNYNSGYEYSSSQPIYQPAHQVCQTQPQHKQLRHSNRPVFYGDNLSSIKPSSFMHSFMPDTYFHYQGPIVSTNLNLDRPRRPHSADFLERSENDLEAEVIFNNLSNISTNFNSNDKNSNKQLTMPQKILPTRPKSSFARYSDKEVGIELYDFPINLPTSGRLNDTSFSIQNDHIDTNTFIFNDQNNLNELTEEEQNSLNQQIFMKPTIRNKQKSDENNSAFKSMHSNSDQQFLFIPEEKVNFEHHYQTRNVTHLQSNILSQPQNRNFSPSLSQNNPVNTHLRNSSHLDVIEPHRDELYKASQLFYRRTSSIISDSGVGASTQSSLYNAQSTNEDWSESGLPTTPATASQDSLTESTSRSGEEKESLVRLNQSCEQSKDNHADVNENNQIMKKNFNNFKTNKNNNSITKFGLDRLSGNRLLEHNDLLLDTENSMLIDQDVYDLHAIDSEGREEICEEILNSTNGENNTTKTDSSIRFKLGHKVRTYRKPRPSSSSSTASSSLLNDTMTQTINKSDSQAPYYITDLLNEQQRRDLQKKLPSNPLPALLSRSTLDSARQAGTTTLSIKTNNIKAQDNIKSTLSSKISLPLFNDIHSYPLPLPSKLGNKSLDDYFGTFNSSESDSTTENVQASASEYGTRRKRRTKRRSKSDSLSLKNDKTDNASDSELHFRRRQRNRKCSSNCRMYASAGDFIGKSRDELTLMLEKYRRQQSKLSTSCDALKFAMESEAKMAELDPCNAPEYRSRMIEIQRQLKETQECVALKQPIVDRIDNLIKNSKTSGSSIIIDNKTDIDADNSIKDKDDNIENLKRQQNILAVELDRVRGLLTQSTRALEAKAVENAKMEAEMQAARRKLKQVLENDKAEAEMTRSAKLERELAHINQVIDNLHSRRQELNSAIENLKYPLTGYENDENMIVFKSCPKSDMRNIKIFNKTKIKEPELTSVTESISDSEESSDTGHLSKEDSEIRSKILKEKYRAFLAANRPLIPLYENLTSNTTIIPSFLTSSQQHSLFSSQISVKSKLNENNNNKNHVEIEEEEEEAEEENDDDDDNNNNDDNDDDEEDENDEFFTLNLPKDMQIFPLMQTQLQNCEFNPQAYHKLTSSSDNRNRNCVINEQLQQILSFQQQQLDEQQIYNQQQEHQHQHQNQKQQQQQQQQQQQLSQGQFLSPKAEIRTVREVKREAERRKHHQAQSAKISALIRSLPSNIQSVGDTQNSNYSLMTSHHFYIQDEQFNENREFLNGNQTTTESSSITAPDLIQSTIH